MDKSINNAVYRYGMEKIFNGALIGFSGGADSSALLHYLSSRCKKLVAVHINHMIRGQEADRDQKFCQDVCEKYGVELITCKVDIPAISKARKKGLEEAAREERYRIFNEILGSRLELGCIVTAHNANDNAETVIFNLARGSGLNGLCGIKPVNGNIYRPMIWVTREEIIRYCQDNKIDYVTDSTNLETDYTRNSIRHILIPQLEKINESFVSACTRVTEILRQDEDYISKQAEDVIRGCRVKGQIPLETLLSLEYSICARVIMAISPITLDYKSVNACIQLAREQKTGKMLSIGSGYHFKIEHAYVHFVSDEEMEKAEINIPLKKGINKIDPLNIIIAIGEDYEKEDYTFSAGVKLNTDFINGGLYLRTRGEGDKIKSGGVTKRLKRVFTDKHIPSHERDKLPIICDSDGIVTVPGVVARDGAFDKRGDLTIKVYIKPTL